MPAKLQDALLGFMREWANDLHAFGRGSPEHVLKRGKELRCCVLERIVGERR
jgi:hypothetical protein